MSVTDTSSPAATELGVGRPVLVLGAEPGSPGLAALAARFHLHALPDAAAAAAWIAAQSAEALGVVAVGAAAAAALAAAKDAGEKVDALVLVSPTGLALDEIERPATPACVLIGERDSAQSIAAHRKALRANVVLVFDSGPDILTDRPDAFASAAGDFLDRKGRFVFAETAALSR